MDHKIAHISQQGEEEMIREHLENVAEQIKKFVRKYSYENIDVLRYAETTGLAHDIGKYSEAFQKRIRGSVERMVDHSTAGMIEMYKRGMLAAAFAGHLRRR